MVASGLAAVRSSRRAFSASLLAGIASLNAAWAAPPTNAKPLRLMVLGDSLSAGYRLPAGSDWVSLLKARLTAVDVPSEVINASVSGDTAWNGSRRLPALLAYHRPDVLVLALGANDGLLRLPLPILQEDLSNMVQLAQSMNIRVLLVGMRLPPFVEPEYNEAFAEVFQRVATERSVPLVPFLLDGVEKRAEMFLPDKLHPSSDAQPTLAANVWSVLRPMLQTSIALAP